MKETPTKSRKETSKGTIVSGIYKIVNKINGKYYIGSSSDINVRWKCHLKELSGGYHHNLHLQRAWKKYGPETFEFKIIKRNISVDGLLREEQLFLDDVKETRSSVYNLTFIAGKVEMTDETRKKIGFRALGHKRNVGRKYSTETIEKRKISRSWYKSHSELTKEKIRTAASGRILSMETKLKISESLKGKIPHNVDYTIFEFINSRSGERFKGTKNDFIKSFNLLKQPVYAIINKSTRLRTYKGWSVVQS
jgi:group I intron endonuclease